MILDHIGFNVSDFPAARRFLEAALAPLGIRITKAGAGWAMPGRDGRGQFWFGSFGDVPGPIHVAFVIGPDGHNIEAVFHGPGA